MPTSDRTYENSDHPSTESHGSDWSDTDNSDWENEFELDDEPDTVQISTPGD